MEAVAEKEVSVFCVSKNFLFNKSALKRENGPMSCKGSAARKRPPFQSPKNTHDDDLIQRPADVLTGVVKKTESEGHLGFEQ